MDTEISPEPAAPGVKTETCGHFGECGGCSRQDVPYEEQLRRKQRAVQEALRGLLEADQVAPVIPSPKIWHCRNKMEFTFGEAPKAAGTAGNGNDLALGLHRVKRFSEIVNLTDCRIHSIHTNAILELIRRFCREHGYTAYRPKSHEGFLRHLIVREAKTTGDLLVHLMTQQGNLDIQGLLNALRSGFPITGFLWSLNTRVADVAQPEKQMYAWGRPFLVEKVGGLEFRISAGSFFQTNTEAALKLYEVVEGEISGFEHLVDVYCGIGTIALLARRAGAKEVFGVDSSEESIADARFNAQELFAAPDDELLRFLCGDAADGLARFGLRRGTDCVVLDPPRSGITRKVAQRVLAMDPRRIVYVSCNPKVLGIDLLRFFPRFRAARAVPVDLFPHTDHMEIVVTLER